MPPDHLSSICRALSRAAENVCSTVFDNALGVRCLGVRRHCKPTRVGSCLLAALALDPWMFPPPSPRRELIAALSDPRPRQTLACRPGAHPSQRVTCLAQDAGNEQKNGDCDRPATMCDILVPAEPSRRCAPAASPARRPSAARRWRWRRSTASSAYPRNSPKPAARAGRPQGDGAPLSSPVGPRREPSPGRRQGRRPRTSGDSGLGTPE